MNLNFKANTSATPLNVPTGVYMAGYADRENGSKGIHDNIYTKALTVSNGEKTIIVISNDLLGVDEELVDKVVSGIKKEINIPEENIFICATHTHSAPHIINWEFDEKNFSCRLNKKLKEYIIDTMIKNALKSAKDLRQIRLAYGKSKCVGVASNRICKEGPVDDSVNVIFLIAENNLPLGVIVNYSCHPTVLGADNEYISADYPGVVQNLVEEYFKNNCVCMFINGACGNQSTRFTRKAQDFNEVKRMGGLVFKSVLEAYDNKEDKNNYEINGIKRYFKFPKKEIPDRKEAMEYYRRTLYDLNKAKNDSNISPQNMRSIITKYQGASISLKLIDVLENINLELPIQIIKLGDILIVGVPVELFNDYGFDIKRESDFNNVIIAGYTNGMVGYVYTPESYEDGDYEAWSSPFGKSTGDFITQNVMSLIKIL
ncbi:hypothetical protein EQM13_15155 [Acidilutibacter cellobiosedens]|uniref:Neutral ceramidase n=1 Tax=Acidilutibacter cellobiosedens TaxID=2507161 RepID=A0A410QFU9_9FIRM|nr:neutral/alkaline non-lysosomal ceramidase N-terminal domain-containing protein [Acidilutibacter cellobiosedens]MBE6083103.1 hypothetical protein [Tissierellaceae bacterium]QAT62809.1 hypothetical protein EQM13_15155 [Acidilutibacter cellobiosedens]